MSSWRSRDKDLDEELRGHLAMAARDRMERGEPPTGAEAPARRELGNGLTIKEGTRETWGWTGVERLGPGLRYAPGPLPRNSGVSPVAGRAPPPAAGRLLSDADDRRGCAARVVLSYPFWQRAYGGDRSIVGRTLAIEAQPVEIIGVAQAGFFGLEVGRSFDVALPICSEPVIHGG